MNVFTEIQSYYNISISAGYGYAENKYIKSGVFIYIVTYLVGMNIEERPTRENVVENQAFMIYYFRSYNPKGRVWPHVYSGPDRRHCEGGRSN